MSSFSVPPFRSVHPALFSALVGATVITALGDSGPVVVGVGWAVPDNPEQRLHHEAPLLDRLVRVRLLLNVCMCVRRHVSSALATICEQRCHRISQGYLGC